jgi:hypothetical protein
MDNNTLVSKAERQIISLEGKDALPVLEAIVEGIDNIYGPNEKKRITYRDLHGRLTWFTGKLRDLCKEERHPENLALGKDAHNFSNKLCQMTIGVATVDGGMEVNFVRFGPEYGHPLTWSFGGEDIADRQAIRVDQFVPRGDFDEVVPQRMEYPAFVDAVLTGVKKALSNKKWPARRPGSN